MSEYPTISEIIAIEQQIRMECFAGNCRGSQVLDLEALQRHYGPDFILETRMHLWKCPRCGQQKGRPYVSAMWAGRYKPEG